MNQFVREALFIGLKEGVKISLCLFLALSFLRNVRREELRQPLFAGLALVFLASFAAMSLPVTLEVRSDVVKMIGYVFGLFYLLSLAALFHTTGTDLLGPFKQALAKRTLLVPLTFLLTVLYFLPDMAGSSLYLADAFSMSGVRLPVFLAAGAGFLAALALAYYFGRKAGVDAAKTFGNPQIFLFLALVKLFSGGVRGFAELSLIPSVQEGLKKLIHDIVHQVFIMLLLPDHPVLTITAWNFIGVLFGNTAGLWLSLLIMTIPLVLFIKKHFTEEIIVPTRITPTADRRIFIKAIRDQRVLKSLPVFVFLIFIAGIWFSERGENAGSLYLPEPAPLSAEGGLVNIPIHGPAEDLLDGGLHKFSITVDNEALRLLIMKKGDGSLAVCLDACEVCPPEGYGQGREHVVCLYCRTPIPIDTLGKPGGCNPIPVKSMVNDKEVRIEVAELAEKWAMVKKGKAGEEAGK